MTDDSGQGGSVTALAQGPEQTPILDVVADRTRVGELVDILTEVDRRLDELARDLEGGRMLPLEAAARVVLIQHHARTSPDGTNYIGRSA